jgi:hypothetical protein
VREDYSKEVSKRRYHLSKNTWDLEFEGNIVVFIAQDISISGSPHSSNLIEPFKCPIETDEVAR